MDGFIKVNHGFFWFSQRSVHCMLSLCINYSRDIIKRKLGPYMLNTSELSADLESGHIHIKAAKKKIPCKYCYTLEQDPRVISCSKCSYD